MLPLCVSAIPCTFKRPSTSLHEPSLLDSPVAADEVSVPFSPVRRGRNGQDIRLRNEGRYYRFASGKHIKALCEASEISIIIREDTIR